MNNTSELYIPHLSVDDQAPAVARHEIVIQASLAAIWTLVTDVERWQTWHPAVTRAKLNGELAPGAVIDWKSKGFAIRSTVREVLPMSRLAWTGRALGTRAIHVWTFTPVAGGVRVGTEESFDGWLVRLMRGSMRKTLDEALIAWLANLKRAAEIHRP